MVLLLSIYIGAFRVLKKCLSVNRLAAAFDPTEDFVTLKPIAGRTPRPILMDAGEPGPAPTSEVLAFLGMSYFCYLLGQGELFGSYGVETTRIFAFEPSDQRPFGFAVTLDPLGKSLSAQGLELLT